MTPRTPRAPETEAALREALQAAWDIGDKLDSNHARWAASQVAERMGVEIDHHNRFSGPPRNRNEEMIAELEEQLDEAASLAAADRDREVGALRKGLRQALNQWEMYADDGYPDDDGLMWPDGAIVERAMFREVRALLAATTPPEAKHD